MGPQHRGRGVVGGPGGKGSPQGFLGQVLELQHSHLGVSGDAPSHTLQVPPVGGQGVGRRLGGPQLEQPAVDELGKARGGRMEHDGRRSVVPLRAVAPPDDLAERTFLEMLQGWRN